MKASESYEEALTTSRLIGDRRYEAISLRALGNLHTKLGESQQAFDSFRQALEILRTVDDGHLKAIVLGGIAFAYASVGERERALEYYEQSLAIYERVNDVWGKAEAEMTIGEIYFSKHDSQSALDHYLRALPLFRAIKMPRQEAKTLRDIGLVYDSWGNKAKALECYQQSLALTRVGQDQRYEAYTLNYIGLLYEHNGDLPKALEYYQRALSLNRVAADPAGESLTLYYLARALRDRGRLDEARDHIAAAVAIAESLRTKVVSHDLRATYLASTHQYYELNIDILMHLDRERSNSGFKAAAFDASERAHGRSLLESLKEARADIRAGVDPDLLERERRLEQAISAKGERHMRLLSEKNEQEASMVAKEITQLTAEYDQVRTQIRSTSPRYAALTQPQPLKLYEIQQLLDDNTLLLEYMLGDERSYVWVVSPREVSSYELPGRAEIERAAREVHSSLIATQPLPDETFEQRQARVAKANQQLPSHVANLSKILVAPVADKLGTKRLLIVPDGALQYIPFQILNKATEPRPLVVDHEIINEPSASALALLVSETKNRKQASDSVAVLADPVFETDDPRLNSAAKPPSTSLTAQVQETEFHQALRDVNLSGDGGRIPRLQASRDEADAIMSVTPWRSGFQAVGFEASRATVMKADLSDYRIVHFATHGLLNNEHPELSGIVLSLFDEKGQPQDGFLRLHDIYNLKLPVDLVVLSACNTALGKDVRGEGLIGLTRGFMYAGASSVVASLWKVDDEATAELMGLFYGYMLRDGLSPAAALRKAQVTMSQQKRWQSPYYWAGFVIQGQYIQNERTSRFPIPLLALWLFGAAVISAAAFYVLKRRRKISF